MNGTRNKNIKSYKNIKNPNTDFFHGTLQYTTIGWSYKIIFFIFIFWLLRTFDSNSFKMFSYNKLYCWIGLTKILLSMVGRLKRSRSALRRFAALLRFSSYKIFFVGYTTNCFCWMVLQDYIFHFYFFVVENL